MQKQLICNANMGMCHAAAGGAWEVTFPTGWVEVKWTKVSWLASLSQGDRGYTMASLMNP